MNKEIIKSVARKVAPVLVKILIALLKIMFAIVRRVAPVLLKVLLVVTLKVFELVCYFLGFFVGLIISIPILALIMPVLALGEPLKKII